jgi:hypothetical protein
LYHIYWEKSSPKSAFFEKISPPAPR